MNSNHLTNNYSNIEQCTYSLDAFQFNFLWSSPVQPSTKATTEG